MAPQGEDAHLSSAIGTADDFDDQSPAAKRGLSGKTDDLGAEAARRRPSRSIENIGRAATLIFAGLQFLIGDAPAIHRRLRGGQQERERYQNASAGSAIRLSAPLSSLRRWALLSGRMRSA